LHFQIEIVISARGRNVLSFLLWVIIWETVTHITLVVQAVGVLFCPDYAGTFSSSILSRFDFEKIAFEQMSATIL
jgi:hypothetical protein